MSFGLTLQKPSLPECNQERTTQRPTSPLRDKTARKQFACEVPHCNKSYVLHQSFLKHVQQAHSENRTTSTKQQVKELVCEQCGKLFKSYCALKVNVLNIPKLKLHENPFLFYLQTETQLHSHR